MRVFNILLLVIILISCNRKLISNEALVENQPHVVQIQFINQFDLEIKRTNNSKEIHYFYNDMAGGNIWILNNEKFSDTIDLGYRPDMDPHKLYPSKVNIDTFDFYKWMVGNGPQDGKYDLKYFDQRNNVESNVTVFDFSRIKYNRPKSSFKNFLDITLDSIGLNTYNINIYNPTIYEIEVENLDIFLSSDSEYLDKKYHFFTEYYIIPKNKLSKNSKSTKLKPNNTITLTYVIDKEDVFIVQDIINGTLYNITFGLKSSKHPLFYDLKHFNRDELAKIKNNEK